MKQRLLYVLLLSSLPWVLMGQVAYKDTKMFYTSLGLKDAKYEISLTHLSPEDEKDFWVDQQNYETLLKRRHPQGYQYYLKGKRQVYQQHKLLCDEGYAHSPLFAQKMSYYLAKGDLLPDQNVVYSSESKQ
ncbi:MAG: hypothetical protein AAGF77_05475 [Bacteroidota bacterium]